MDGARFELELSARDGGCGPRGADAVEMMIAPNAGGPIGAAARVASGGELSRVMLALLASRTARAGGGRGEPLLVFDEIDAGIGGHTARAVGEHLRSLADGRQILCITHLPQVAALAQRHFTIVKDGAGHARAHDRRRARGRRGRRRARADARRLRARPAASEHARELLRAA